MRIAPLSLPTLLAGLTATTTLLQMVAAASVIGIDYGQDWYKVALVKPGFPLDLVLNRDSKRKTASAVTIYKGERSYGSDALSLASRYPPNAFSELKQLFGRSYDDPVCAAYRDAHVNRMEAGSDQSVVFRVDDSDAAGNPFPLQELVAMQLAEAKRQASETAKEPVRDCVIAVPSYFSPAERQTVLDAAELAGLRVQQLLNDGAAVALNYAMTRSFNDTPEYHVLFDMGAASTTVTVASYRTVSVRDAGKYFKNVAQVELHGLAYDRHLGGGDLDRRVRDHLADAFTQSVKSLKQPIRENPRAMSKLLKEANRVKQILSANQDTTASVEGLHEDHDFRFKITRATLESLTEDIRPRIADTVRAALTRANIAASEIQSVLLMGGGARVPFVQSILKEVVGDRIAQGINGDEAVVLGAAFRGAGSLRQFRVKEIILKDLVHYPITIRYHNEPTQEGTPGKERSITLFKRGASAYIEKIMTFPHKNDFEFEAYYSPEAEDDFVGSPEIFRAKVTGVQEALTVPDTHKLLNAKIKVTMKIGLKGELLVDKAMAHLELEGPPAEKTEKADSKSEDNKAETDEKDAASASPVKESKQVKLSVSVEATGVQPMPEALMQVSKDRLNALDDEDRLRQLRDEARNNLESFVYRVQDLLDDRAYQAVSTADARETLQQQLSAASDWLYDDGMHAETKDFRQRLSELQAVHDPIMERRAEHTQRSGAIAALQSVISNAREWVKTIIATPEDERYHTADELDGLTKSVNDAEQWLADTQAAISSQAIDVMPSVRAADITVRSQQLQESYDQLVNKLRPSPPSAEAKTEGSEKSGEDGEATKDAPEEAPAKEEPERDEL